MNDIILGTAQFGMDYGINNTRGKIPYDEIPAIMDRSFASGVDTVDTAVSYGESESIIGNYLKRSKKPFKVISKLPACGSEDVRKIVSGSLKKLNASTICGYLIHNFASYEKDAKVWSELEHLREGGIIEKIGFSLYTPSELEKILKAGLEIDIIQIPYSIFDHRFTPYLSALKKMGIELHARSVFLQGLCFKDPEKVGENFTPFKQILKKLRTLSGESAVPVSSICLDFVLQDEFIDKVIVGVDNLRHLEEILKAPEYSAKVNDILCKLDSFTLEDEDIILPFRWKKG